MINLYYNCFVENFDPEKIADKVLINFSDNFLDKKKNLFIAMVCIKSFTPLNVGRALFNIKLDTFFSLQDQMDLEKYIRYLYPKTILDINFDRPSSIYEWRIESNKVEDFFDDNPIIYTYNHDHLFSSHSISLFFEYLNEFSNKAYSQKDNIFCISHHPEFNSIAFDLKKFLARANLQNMKFEFSDIIQHGIFSKLKAKNYIEGNFIGYKSLSKYLWSKAIQAYGDSYVPRPDHNTVLYKDLNLSYWIQSDELFRHFDGYNHITNLSQYDYSFFYNRSPEQINISSSSFSKKDKYVPLIINNFVDNENKEKSKISSEAKYLLGIFFIAIRDSVFYSLFILKETINIKKMIREIFSFYKGGNIKIDNLDNAVKIKLYSEIVKEVQDNMPSILADCLTILRNTEKGLGPIPFSPDKKNIFSILYSYIKNHLKYLLKPFKKL